MQGNGQAWEIEQLRGEIQELREGAFPRIVRRLVTAATYTVQPREELIAVNYAGAVTITLPNFSAHAQLSIFSYLVHIKDESGVASTNNITISGNGSDIIARANSSDTFDVAYGSVANVTINSDYGFYVLYFNGTVWHSLTK